MFKCRPALALLPFCLSSALVGAEPGPWTVRAGVFQSHSSVCPGLNGSRGIQVELNRAVSLSRRQGLVLRGGVADVRGERSPKVIYEDFPFGGVKDRGTTKGRVSLYFVGLDYRFRFLESDVTPYFVAGPTFGQGRLREEWRDFQALSGNWGARTTGWGGSLGFGFQAGSQLSLELRTMGLNLEYTNGYTLTVGYRF